MSTRESDCEKGLIARVFYRRGGQRLQETFVEAKTMGVSGEWFSDPQCHILWRAAEKLFSGPDFETVTVMSLIKAANGVAKESKDEEISTASVDKKFFDEAERLVGGADPIASYVKIVKDQYVVRKCKESFRRACDAFAAGDDTASVVASLVSDAQGIVSNETSVSRVSVSDMVDEVTGAFTEAYHQVQELGNANYTPGLPLPWRKLAFSINGFTKTLTVLAARPGVGKTSLAVELMRFWMDNGVKVVFNSLDMSGPELIKRQLAEQSQISSRKLQFGKSSKEDWEKYDRPALIEAGNRLKQLERDGVYTLFAEHDIDILKANVKILKDQGLIDVLVVDYIQLMTYRGSDRVSKQQCVTRVSNMLHSITTQFGIPVLALSQINRDSSKEGLEPALHDIKDSGAIEQDATNVLILHPNRELKQKWDDNPPTQFVDEGDVNAARPLMPMWLIVAKARDGDAGTKIPMLVVQSKSSWYQADYENRDGGKDDKWNRVWDNWKHDPIESFWERKGSLIRAYERAAIEQVNRRNSPHEQASDRPVLQAEHEAYVRGIELENASQDEMPF